MSRLAHNFFFLMIFLVSGKALAAESVKFLQTSPKVVQDTTLTTKVVISEDRPGVFLIFGPPTDLQQFHPAYVRTGDKSFSFFLTYNPETASYSSIQVGTKSYKINDGSFFSIDFGGLRVAIDNRNPYFSIVREDPDNKIEPAIIGFRGTDLVVNSSGNDLVALLEANQLSDLKVIKPYTMGKDELLLEGKPVRTGRIGIATNRQANPCLNSEGAVFLGEDDRKALQTANREDQSRILSQILSRDEGSRTPFENLLVLRVTKDEVLGLDYQKSRIRTIRDLKSNSRYTVCLVKDLPL